MQINEKGFSEKSDNTLTLLMDGFTESPENARLLVISGDRHKRYCVTIMTLADGKMASLTASSMYALAYELNDKWGFSMDFDQTCDFELGLVKAIDENQAKQSFLNCTAEYFKGDNRTMLEFLSNKDAYQFCMESDTESYHHAKHRFAFKTLAMASQLGFINDFHSQPNDNIGAVIKNNILAAQNCASQLCGSASKLKIRLDDA